jgi:mRNA interferase RelE/StbE
MGVVYTVLYHELVLRDDIQDITKTWKEKIRHAIEVKLTSNPIAYGKPLRRTLAGYRKMRVGDYRVIFKVNDSVVKILMIKHRSKVYEEIGDRV